MIFDLQIIEGVSSWVYVSHERGRQETFTSDTLSSITRVMSLCLFLSLSLFLSDTQRKESWTDGEMFSFRENLLMIPITIILMEILMITIIIMTVVIIVLILFVFILYAYSM